MLKKIAALVFDGICNDLGFPVELRRLLKNQPEMRVELPKPKLTVCVSSVVEWDRWAEVSSLPGPHYPLGTVMGWKKSGNYYHGFTSVIPALASFAVSEKTESWSCDIQDVQGLAHSKSRINEFSNLDEFTESRSAGLISDMSITGLDKRLAHTEIRIIHEERSDYFKKSSWDGRVFLMNSGGSHNFSAARYIAKRIDKKVPLNGMLITKKLNPQAINALNADFDMFAISDAAVVFNDFFDAMEAFETTFYWLNLPRPYSGLCAVFLPKKEKRSRAVAKILRDNQFFDLGRHLEQISK